MVAKHQLRPRRGDGGQALAAEGPPADVARDPAVIGALTGRATA